MRISSDDVQIVELSKCCQAPVWACEGGDYDTCESCGEDVEPRADGLFKLLSNLSILGIHWQDIDDVYVLGTHAKGTLRLRIDHKHEKSTVVHGREPQ